LFGVAFIGGMIITLAVFLQVVQVVVSVRQRKQNMDTTGDPWDAKTLEWATASPPPAYNFAIIPEVTSRDAFLAIKQSETKAGKPVYQDIHMPKSTGSGIYISAFIFMFGFAMVWQLFWLAAIGLIGAIVCLIMRAFDDDTEYTITAAEVAALEAKRTK
jgi:cytochrome o ubiquinol oxidase subunit 1